MKREELYRKFGPKLIDAIVQVQIDESNLFREVLGLPTINAVQVIDAIVKKLENIPDYDWMSEEV